MLKKMARIMLGTMVLFVVPAALAAVEASEYFERANVLLDEGKSEAAIAAYEAFIKDNPEHELVPAAKWAIAHIYFVIDKDYGKAALLYQHIIRRHADTGWEIMAYQRLGECYEQQGRWAEAVRLYDSALVRLTAPVHAETAVDGWYDNFKQKLVAYYRRASDPAAVARVYDEALTRFPAGLNAAGDLLSLARLHFEMRDSALAISELVAVVDRYPFSEAAREVHGTYRQLLAARAGYDWVAFTTFQTCLKLSESGRFEEAAVGFDTVIARKRGTGMDHAARFQKELLEFRKTGNAVWFRENLINARETYPYGFGGVRELGLFDILETIIQARPAAAEADDFIPHARMAYAYYELRAYYPAIENYERAIERAPDQSRLHVMLGYCYMGVMDYDQAILAFRRSIALSPHDPNMYDSMAEAYYARGDADQAIEFYEQALSIDSTFANPYYMLGEIHAAAGRKDEAVRYLRRYLDRAPDGPRAAGARTLLDVLTGDR